MKGIIFFLSILFFSCEVFSPVSEFEVLNGKHCMIPISDEKIPRKQFEKILQFADEAFVEITRETGLQYYRKIPVTYDPNRVSLYNPASAYVHSNTVFIQSDFFGKPDYEQKEILCHEITHVIMIGTLGTSDSFLTTEGAAMFWYSSAYNYKTGTLSLQEVAELSYYKLHVNNLRQRTPEYIRNCYLLSGQFTLFWIKRFGWDHLFKLYQELTPQNAVSKIEELSQIPLNEIEQIIKKGY